MSDNSSDNKKPVSQLEKPRMSSGLGSPRKKYPNVTEADFEWAREHGILPAEPVSFQKGRQNSFADMKVRKFDEEMQGKYLDALMRTGVCDSACQLVGIHPRTVQKHAAEDPVFKADRDMAYRLFKSNAEAMLTHQFMMGQKEQRRDKDGNIVFEKTTYEQQARILLLKYFNPAYIETQKSEVAVTGGAVIVPPPTDVEDWQATVAKWTGQPINTTGTEVKPPELGPAADDKE
jgi:hypothetical protein